MANASPKVVTPTKNNFGVLLHNGQIYIRDTLFYAGDFELFLAQQALVGQGLLIQEVSISHSTTHHSR